MAEQPRRRRVVNPCGNCLVLARGRGHQRVGRVDLQDRRDLPGKGIGTCLQRTKRRGIGVQTCVNGHLVVVVRIVGVRVRRERPGRTVLEALVNRQDDHLARATQLAVHQDAAEIAFLHRGCRLRNLPGSSEQRASPSWTVSLGSRNYFAPGLSDVAVLWSRDCHSGISADMEANPDRNGLVRIAALSRRTGEPSPCCFRFQRGRMSANDADQFLFGFGEEAEISDLFEARPGKASRKTLGRAPGAAATAVPAGRLHQPRGLRDAGTRALPRSSTT